MNKEFTSTEKILNQTVCPRLQIIGQVKTEENEVYQEWYYELVYEHFTEKYEKVLMGKQQRYGGLDINDYRDKEGFIEPPMRIKADSKWDSIQLNLPLFYIWNDHVERVDLTEFKEKFKDKLNKKAK